ncbi:MAG: hypothetical protein Q4G58_14300 [bacterium]|nr:hypothetical protein [bacterium]
MEVMTVLLFAVSLVMLFKPTLFWKITEAWKTDGGEPSEVYKKHTRFGGGICCIVSAACLIGFALTACAGMGDYELELINGYKVMRISAGDVLISNKNGETVIDGHVWKYCKSERYIGAQQVAMDIENKADASNPTYYIIDTETDKVIMGMSQEEYTVYIEEHKILDLSDWKETSVDEINVEIANIK